MDHQAKQRKRSAVSSLRALALELGLNTSRRRADLSKDDFIALHAEVAIQRTTPEQKARASEAMQLYVGTVCRGRSGSGSLHLDLDPAFPTQTAATHSDLEVWIWIVLSLDRKIVPPPNHPQNPSTHP